MTQQTLETRVKDLETLVSRLNNTDAYGNLRYGQPDIRSATNADLLAEVAARIAADSTLTINLATEAATRGSADTALSASIAAIAAPLIASPTNLYTHPQNNTTLANIAGFTINLAANSRYAFIFHINYTSSSAADFKFDLGPPASATGEYYLTYYTGTVVADSASFAVATAPLSLLGNGGSPFSCMAMGDITTTTADVIQFRAAQVTSDATSTTVAKSSYIIAWKLP